MARNILITLGLVSIPVAVNKATEDVRSGFHNVCDQGHPPARTRQSLACSACGNDDRSTFVKGREADDGGYIIVSPEELKEATAVDPKVINAMALSAHPRDGVMGSTVVTGKVYNLLPGKGVDPSQYATVVEAVRRAEQEGTVLTTVWAYNARSAPAMYLIQARDESLVASEMAWPEAVRAVPPVEGDADEALVGQFTSLITMSRSAFDPEAHRDGRAETIEALLASKTPQASGDPEAVDAPKALAPGSTNIADQLAAALAAAQPEQEDWAAKNKPELVEACRERDLPVSGTKAELIARLGEAA